MTSDESKLTFEEQNRIAAVTDKLAPLKWDDTIFAYRQDRMPAAVGWYPVRYRVMGQVRVERLYWSGKRWGWKYSSQGSRFDFSACIEDFRWQGRAELPLDPEGKNDDRAEWASAGITAFARATQMVDHEDNQTILADFLTDIRHWCDRNDVDFLTALGSSAAHYGEETTK